MASNLNNWNVGGRLTKDPVTKKIPNGSTFTAFSIANNVWKNGSEQAQFVECRMFGDVAERFNKIGVKKGWYIELGGPVSLRFWGDNNDKVSLDLDVLYFSMAPTGKKDEGSGESAPQQGSSGRGNNGNSPNNRSGGRSEASGRGNATRGNASRNAPVRAPEPPFEPNADDDVPSDDGWEESEENQEIPF